MDFGLNGILMLMAIMGALIIIRSRQELKVLGAFCFFGLFLLVIGSLLPEIISVALFMGSTLLIAYVIYRKKFQSNLILRSKKFLEGKTPRELIRYFTIATGGICLSWIVYFSLHTLLALLIYTIYGIPVFTAHQLGQTSNNLFFLADAGLNGITIILIVALYGRFYEPHRQIRNFKAIIFTLGLQVSLSLILVALYLTAYFRFWRPFL